jgi:hypothetical protein
MTKIPVKFICPNCGDDERTCDCRDYPYGKCVKCGGRVDSMRDGEDADGNRGRTLIFCTNEDCEDYGE